jgi:hypothetical protein
MPVNLTLQEIVQQRAESGDGRQLANFIPGGRNGRPENIGGQREF